MEKKQNTNEFQLQELLPIAMVFVVTVIGIAFGLTIISDVQDDFTANSAEHNATADGITAIGSLASKLPLIATVVVAAVLIGILVRYLFVKFV